MRWDKRTQVIVLVAGLVVWAGALYWRLTQPDPAPAAAPPSTEATSEGGNRPGALGAAGARPVKPSAPGRKGAGGRAATAQEGAPPPTLRLDLLERPLPPLTAEGKNLFASVAAPPPPPPPPKGAAAAAAPPPDPFLEEAHKLRLVAVMQEDGQAVAFIADGNDVLSVKKHDVIRSRFLVKDVGDDAVVVSQPNGQKEVRLVLTTSGGATQH
ncbi:MAG TPA: hypothetical protein VED18_08330 [Candidatus Sulfotelmatobacter sp.]|nr:hypothetical protein [Candidatus Sulfotelmatobacter sp.]